METTLPFFTGLGKNEKDLFRCFPFLLRLKQLECFQLQVVETLTQIALNNGVLFHVIGSPGQSGLNLKSRTSELVDLFAQP